MFYLNHDNAVYSCYFGGDHHPQKWSYHWWQEYPRQWEEVGRKGYSRRVTRVLLVVVLTVPLGLQRVRDTLLSQLREVTMNKPRAKDDDLLITEITRLESALQGAREELVRYHCGPYEVSFDDAIRALASLKLRGSGMSSNMLNDLSGRITPNSRR